MKRVILIVALMLCLVGVARAEEQNTPEPDKAVTLWLSGSSPAYQNTNLSAMFGIKDKNAEAGIAVECRMFSEGDTANDIQSDLAIGPYAVYHFPDILDVNNPLNIPWLPEKIAGHPFVGLSYVVDRSGKGAAMSPFAGIRLLDLFTLKGKYSFYHGVDAKDELQLGLSLQWKFSGPKK